MQIEKINNKSWPAISILLAFTLLNFLQAAFLGLLDDECYYWMYSQFLDWGYFDHPPAIALMIKSGTIFSKSEWAVRLFSVLAQSLSLVFIWKMVEDPLSGSVSDSLKESLKDKMEWAFWLIVLMLPIFQIYGFLATPDAPLFLFSAIFLFLFKKYLSKDNWVNAFLLGTSMAVLMYSKYHGALVITLAFVVHPKLLKRPNFYAAVLLSLLLYFPHFFWQFQNEIPSVKYHLVDRIEGFNLLNPLRFIAEQVLVFNPLFAVLLFPLIFGGHKLGSNSSDFQKSLWSIVIGLFLFFFLSSFRNRGEAHWVAVASIPLIVLAFQAVLNGQISKEKLYHLALPSVLILFALRLVLVMGWMDFPPEFYDSNEWVSKVEEKANGLPVLFVNSYQKAAKYEFYTAQPSMSLNNVAYRKNQYDLWEREQAFQNKEVMICTSTADSGFEKLKGVKEPTFCRKQKNFRSVQRFETKLIRLFRNESDTHWIVEAELTNPYEQGIPIEHGQMHLHPTLVVYKGGVVFDHWKMKLMEAWVGDNTIVTEANLVDLGKTSFRFSLKSDTPVELDGFSGVFSFYNDFLPPPIMGRPQMLTNLLDE